MQEFINFFTENKTQKGKTQANKQLDELMSERQSSLSGQMRLTGKWSQVRNQEKYRLS